MQMREVPNDGDEERGRKSAVSFPAHWLAVWFGGDCAADGEGHGLSKRKLDLSGPWHAMVMFWTKVDYSHG